MLHKFETKDTKEALRIIQSLDMALVLFELGNIRRKYLKYDDNISEGEAEVVVKVFDDIFEEIDKRGLVIDNLVD